MGARGHSRSRSTLVATVSAALPAQPCNVGGALVMARSQSASAPWGRPSLDFQQSNQIYKLDADRDDAPHGKTGPSTVARHARSSVRYRTRCCL
jgi:hypothetical protein